MATWSPTPNFHQRVRLIRAFSGLNQSEMARRLGVTQGWLSKLEAGIGDITARHLISLREHFGVSADAFVDGVIPYLDISNRFGAPIPLPLHYSHAPSFRVRHLYPFLSSLEKRRGSPTVRGWLEQVELPEHLLAEPRLPINGRLMESLFEHLDSCGLFSESQVWPEICRAAISTITIENEYSSLLRFDEPSGAYARLFGNTMGLFEVSPFYKIRTLDNRALEVEAPASGLASHGEHLCSFRKHFFKNVGELSSRFKVNVRETSCEVRDRGVRRSSGCVYQLKWAN